MEEKFMRRAIELAKEAESHDEVPIGAVIVLNGEIVAEGNNRKERDNCALSHAETVAIAAAAKKLGWYLSDCEMYVTLEPCAMCAGALVNTRVDRVVYGMADPRSGCAGSALDVTGFPGMLHRVQVTGGVLEEECKALVRAFFARVRKK